MKLLLIGSLLFSGGGAVALQNDDVSNTVSQTYNRAKVMVQHKFKGRIVERVKENGFPYPSERVLASLTDEQEAVIMTTIDQINATYDWQNMTDEEIIAALREVHTEMVQLREDLGIQQPTIEQNRHSRRWKSEFAPGRAFNQNGQQGRSSATDEYPCDTPTDASSDAA